MYSHIITVCNYFTYTNNSALLLDEVSWIILISLWSNAFGTGVSPEEYDQEGKVSMKYDW